MRYAEYCQQLKYLKHQPDELKELLKQRPLKRWAYCIHDKDEYEDGSPKEPHIHVMMQMYSDQTADNIAKWFDDEPNRIEKGKSNNKSFMYENMCSYLVHETETADGKYHYDDNEVVASFDFHSFMEDIRTQVQESKERVKKHPIQDVLMKICKNEIPRIRIDEYLTDMQRIKYDKDIEKAYRIRDERLAKEVNRQMEVMYFFGESGTGKTTWAKQYARQMNYNVFVSGSSNDPLQGYLGQECIILDDVRGSDWKINDLLKILDNNTNSLAKSRYSNKLLNDCKLIILTSTQTIESLYETLGQHETEPIEQLKRRCGLMMQFTEDTIQIYQYNADIREYEKIGKAVPNPVKAMKFLSNNKYMVDKMMQALTDFEEDFNNPKGENYVPW